MKLRKVGWYMSHWKGRKGSCVNKKYEDVVE